MDITRADIKTLPTDLIWYIRRLLKQLFDFEEALDDFNDYVSELWAQNTSPHPMTNDFFWSIAEAQAHYIIAKIPNKISYHLGLYVERDCIKFWTIDVEQERFNFWNDFINNQLSVDYLTLVLKNLKIHQYVAKIGKEAFVEVMDGHLMHVCVGELIGEVLEEIFPEDIDDIIHRVAFYNHAYLFPTQFVF